MIKDQIVSAMRLIQKRSQGSPDVWYWRPSPGKHNFGDTLFFEIAQKIIGGPIREAPISGIAPRLICGGSTLHFLRNGDYAWGIGYNSDRRHRWRLRPKRSKIYSVRGPLTANFVTQALSLPYPLVSGDPALLTPRYFPEYRDAKITHKIGLISHYNESKPFDADNVKYIDPLQHPNIVIPEILSCEKVISSSLHGIIVAEVFGRPAVWLASNPLKVGHTKFFDYYLSTARIPEPARSYNDALLLFRDPPEFGSLIQKLEDTFPRGLFDK